MSLTFDSQQGLIIVPVEITAPSGNNAILRLALDTGATITLINVDVLIAIGYNPALTSNHIKVTTGSREEIVPSITLSKIFEVFGNSKPAVLVFLVSTLQRHCH